MNEVERLDRLQLIRAAGDDRVAGTATREADPAPRRQVTTTSKYRRGPAPFITPKGDGIMHHRALPNRMFTTMPRYR